MFDRPIFHLPAGGLTGSSKAQTRAGSAGDRPTPPLAGTRAFFENSDTSLAAEAAEAANPVNFDGYSRDHLLKAANEFISDARFGAYGGEFGRPFSRQFKKAVRDQFGAYDGALFNAIDQSEAGAWRSAFRLRLYTFIPFLLAGGFFFGATEKFLGEERPTEIGDVLDMAAAFGAFVFELVANLFNAVLSAFSADAMEGASADALGPLWYFACLTAFFAFMYGARTLIRNVTINALEKNIAELASTVIKGVTNLNTQITNAIKASYDRGDKETDWPRVSGEWVKIALWIDQRYEYVDRYVSLAAWRVENAFNWISGFYQTLNISIAVVFIAAAARLFPGELNPDVAMAGLAAFGYFIFATFLWSFFNSRRDSFWQEKFDENFGDFDKDRVHIFDDVRTIVERDKRDKVKAEIGR